MTRLTNEYVVAIIPVTKRTPKVPASHASEWVKELSWGLSMLTDVETRARSTQHDRLSRVL